MKFSTGFIPGSRRTSSGFIRGDGTDTYPCGWSFTDVEKVRLMTSSSPDSSYKVITKQIFIPQETLHRVLILSFADPKTNAAKKSV